MTDQVRFVRVELSERRGGQVARVTIDNNRKLNTLNSGLMDQFVAVVAGLEIAAACDLRVAVDTASFGMPEVRLGIPSVVEAALLPMLIGWGRTRRLLLLGETIGAAEAERWGLVEAVVAPPALRQSVDAWVDMLLEAGPRAVTAQKRLMRSWEDLPVRAAISAGIDAFAASWEDEEPRRAMQAFLDRQAARKARPG